MSGDATSGGYKNGNGSALRGWITIIVSVLVVAAGIWTQMGADRQRIAYLETEVTTLQQQVTGLRQSMDDGIAGVRSDTSYIKGRVDYLNAAVTDLRQKH